MRSMTAALVLRQLARFLPAGVTGGPSSEDAVDSPFPSDLNGYPHAPCVDSDGHRRELGELALSGAGFASFNDEADFQNLAVAILCVCGAGLASGLTMAIVSLEAVELRVLVRAGDASEQKYATKLLPLVAHLPHHHLLVTLLLCNAFFNEMLPLALDALVPSWVAILISVTAVLFVGEIIPASIFTGPNKLAIAANFVNFAWFILFFFAPIAYPIASLLDWAIPAEGAEISRNEIRALVAVHRELAAESGAAEPFRADEEGMIRGALSLHTLTADSADILMPISKVFSLSLDGVMDRPTMHRIVESGFSRIPVHVGSDPKLLVGYILVKDHLLLNPDQKVPIKSLFLYKPVCAFSKLTLSSLLNEFQTGLSHMAFVSHDPSLLSNALDEFKAALNSGDQALQHEACGAVRRARLVGLVTLENVVEVILNEQVYDEGDRREAANRLQRFMRKVAIPALRERLSFRASQLSGAGNSFGSAAGSHQTPRVTPGGTPRSSDAIAKAAKKLATNGAGKDPALPRPQGAAGGASSSWSGHASKQHGAAVTHGSVAAGGGGSMGGMLPPLTSSSWNGSKHQPLTSVGLLPGVGSFPHLGRPSDPPLNSSMSSRRSMRRSSSLSARKSSMGGDGERGQRIRGGSSLSGSGMSGEWTVSSGVQEWGEKQNYSSKWAAAGGTHGPDKARIVSDLDASDGRGSSPMITPKSPTPKQLAVTALKQPLLGP